MKTSTTNSSTKPHVVFKQMTLELETELITEFLDSNWKERITKTYPDFLNVSKLKGQAKTKFVREKIMYIREQLAEKMTLGKQNIEANWRLIEEKYLFKLSEIIQTVWPTREISALISINPICPRFLDTWEFSVCPDNKNPNMIIAHELSHFLYFQKLHEVIPEIKKSEYEFPNNPWVLSEIVTTIILNDDRIKKILGGKESYYAEHEDIRINGRLLVHIVHDLYDSLVMEENDFAKFLIEIHKLKF